MSGLENRVQLEGNRSTDTELRKELANVREEVIRLNEVVATYSKKEKKLEKEAEEAKRIIKEYKSLEIRLRAYKETLSAQLVLKNGDNFEMIK